ncbi:unnamed protein product [Urochloa humidicola]
MEARFGRRRLGVPPPRGPRRRCPGGDRVDRISGLNDDLLIQVLVRLRCAGAAARTSVLARRWRDLWKHLPELFFRRIAPDALQAALAQVAIPKLSILDIDVPDEHEIRDEIINVPHHLRLSAQGVTSLFRAAARLDPVELRLTAWMDPDECKIAIEVPSFARATSIRLDVNDLRLAPPALGGEISVLERLSVTNSGCFDTGALISRCPQLRLLELIGCWVLGTITVHSATIEELHVTGGQL